MASLDPAALSPAMLAPMLRVWAQGLYGVEAAVELLIAHRHWLSRADFRVRCISASDRGREGEGPYGPIATIDWAAAADFQGPATPGDRSILWLACSLADGPELPVALGHEISTLEAEDVILVLNAIAHTAGWHDFGISTRVTGVFEADQAGGGDRLS
jgi:hypothetical protein